MSVIVRISSAPPPGADLRGGVAVRLVLTQAVWKLFFGDRGKILIHEVGLSRNNDSSTLPSGFNFCAVGLGVRVFTQPGPKPDVWRLARPLQ